MLLVLIRLVKISLPCTCMYQNLLEKVTFSMPTWNVTRYQKKKEGNWGTIFTFSGIANDSYFGIQNSNILLLSSYSVTCIHTHLFLTVLTPFCLIGIMRIANPLCSPNRIGVLVLLSSSNLRYSYIPESTKKYQKWSLKTIGDPSCKKSWEGDLVTPGRNHIKIPSYFFITADFFISLSTHVLPCMYYSYVCASTWYECKKVFY